MKLLKCLVREQREINYLKTNSTKTNGNTNFIKGISEYDVAIFDCTSGNQNNTNYYIVIHSYMT